ncbi:MAG: hypothetical protein ACFFC7_16645 [Candidatus Hermodarchaeota archaeon]
MGVKQKSLIQKELISRRPWELMSGFGEDTRTQRVKDLQATHVLGLPAMPRVGLC